MGVAKPERWEVRGAGRVTAECRDPMRPQESQQPATRADSSGNEAAPNIIMRLQKPKEAGPLPLTRNTLRACPAPPRVGPGYPLRSSQAVDLGGRSRAPRVAPRARARLRASRKLVGALP